MAVVLTRLWVVSESAEGSTSPVPLRLPQCLAGCGNTRILFNKVLSLLRVSGFEFQVSRFKSQISGLRLGKHETFNLKRETLHLNPETRFTRYVSRVSRTPLVAFFSILLVGVC